MKLGLLREPPHRLTGDDLIFEVLAVRNDVSAAERDAAREKLFAKPQAWLRASPIAIRRLRL